MLREWMFPTKQLDCPIHSDDTTSLTLCADALMEVYSTSKLKGISEEVIASNLEQYVKRIPWRTCDYCSPLITRLMPKVK